MAAPLEPETTPEEYRQRALLLADLGRYDEAAGEIAAGLSAAPEEPNLLATLARIHLAAEQPAEALRAADRANAAAPAILHTLVVRAMALTDSRRYGDAAQVAVDILRNWPGDAYAQRTGAALLSEARNGQEALNAAWNGVRVAPAEAEAHLVLAVVAARLRLFDLAQRAYAEALDLDPAIGEAQRDVGIVRFERRRWAQALEALADEASLPAEPEPIEDTPYPEPFPRPYQAPDRPLPDEPPGLSSASWSGLGPDETGPDRTGSDRTGPDGERRGGNGPGGNGPGENGPGGNGPGGNGRSGSKKGRTGRSDAGEDKAGRGDAGEGNAGRGEGNTGMGDLPPVSRPAGSVLDPSGETVATVRQAVLYGANWTLIAAVITAAMSLASDGISRTWAALIGLLILGGVTFWLNRQLPEPLAGALARLRAHRRPLAAAAYLTFAAPVLLPFYALVGGVGPLVAGMLLAAIAEMIVLTSGRRAG